MDNALSFFTLQTSRLVLSSHYEKVSNLSHTFIPCALSGSPHLSSVCDVGVLTSASQEMKRLHHLIDDLNTRTYNPRGLHILWPRKVAFMFVRAAFSAPRLLYILTRATPYSLRLSITYVCIPPLPVGRAHHSAFAFAVIRHTCIHISPPGPSAPPGQARQLCSSMLSPASCRTNFAYQVLVCICTYVIRTWCSATPPALPPLIRPASTRVPVDRTHLLLPLSHFRVYSMSGMRSCACVWLDRVVPGVILRYSTCDPAASASLRGKSRPTIIYT